MRAFARYAFASWERYLVFVARQIAAVNLRRENIEIYSNDRTAREISGG